MRYLYFLIIGVFLASCSKENPTSPEKEKKGLLKFELEKDHTHVRLTIEADRVGDKVLKPVDDDKILIIGWESWNMPFYRDVAYESLPVVIEHIPLDRYGVLIGNCYILAKDSVRNWFNLDKWNTDPSGAVVSGDYGKYVQLKFPVIPKGLITFVTTEDGLHAIAMIWDSIGFRLMKFTSEDSIDSIGFASDVYGWPPEGGLTKKYDGSLPMSILLQPNLNKIIRGTFFIKKSKTGEIIFFDLKKWRTNPDSLIIDDGQGELIIEYHL